MDVVLDWRNIKTVILHTLEESLEKFAHKNIENLRRWDNINYTPEKFDIQEVPANKNRRRSD